MRMRVSVERTIGNTDESAKWYLRAGLEIIGNLSLYLRRYSRYAYAAYHTWILAWKKTNEKWDSFFGE